MKKFIEIIKCFLEIDHNYCNPDDEMLGNCWAKNCSNTKIPKGRIIELENPRFYFGTFSNGDKN